MPDLLSPPKYFRAAPFRQTGELQVDPRGGQNQAGIIRGLAVITRGEALGHDLWIDQEFVAQVAEHLNRPNKGLKSRFAHPGLSSDGLGRHVGRATDASVVGDKVIADMHFAKSAHKTPDGDLAGYLMDLAQDDSESLGMSIVFHHDQDAMQEFLDEHGGLEFQSPDPLNTRNLPHARLAELRAVDFVDEPAANPNGLFHRGQEIPDEAFCVADYALGRTDQKPAGTFLGLDAERVRHFVTRYMHQNGLEILMANDATTPDTQEEQPEDVKPVEETAQESSDTQEAQPEPARSEASRYREAFGDQGAIWYADGKSFEECRSLEVATLRETIEKQNETIEKLNQRLSADPGEGEATPVGFDSADNSKQRSFIRFRSSLN